VVYEAINHFLPKGGEQNMGIDRKDPSTHPRFNFRSGPNGSEKKQVIVEDRKGTAKVYSLSKDTVVMHHWGIDQWLINKIPARPPTYEVTPPESITKVPTHLRKLGGCDSEALAARYHAFGYF